MAIAVEDFLVASNCTETMDGPETYVYLRVTDGTFLEIGPRGELRKIGHKDIPRDGPSWTVGDWKDFS